MSENPSSKHFVDPREEFVGISPEMRGVPPDKPKIPEFQLAALGRYIAGIVARHKGAGFCTVSFETLDFGRTIVGRTDEVEFEITLRYPVTNVL